MLNYNDKIALVTGAGSGLGLALSKALAEKGCCVFLSDLEAAMCDAGVAEILQAGGEAYALALDVTEPAQFADIIATIVAEKGQLDLLINNAGLAISGEFRDVTLEQWRKVSEVNYMGMVNGSKHAYDRMCTQGSGMLINIASMYGLVPSPMVSTYVATKHAVYGFSRCLAWEAKKYGVQVAVACPGFIQTRLFENGSYARISQQDALSLLPVKFITAERASEIILQQVARGKSVIRFPFYVRAYHRLYRWLPALLEPGYRWLMKHYRAKQTS